MLAILAFIKTPLGRYVLGVGAVLLIVGGIYLKGRSDGKAAIQAKWDAAVQAAIERGEGARRDAERDTPPDGVPNDRLNRD